MVSDPPSRVYLITKPSRKRDGTYPDLSTLERHGEIHYLLDECVRPSRVPQAAFDQIEDRLGDFDYRFDRVAWAGGDMLAAIMTGVCLAALDIPYFTFLRYDRNWDPKTRRRYEGGYYSPVRVSLLNRTPDPNQMILDLKEGRDERD